MAIYCSHHEKDQYESSSRWNRLPNLAPSVTFKTRVRDESIEGTNPFKWQDLSTFELFAGKKVILFSLPGAFTPTCSTYQLPDFEQLADDFYVEGYEHIYCISVNDSFVMNKWAQDQKLENVRVIPDGNGDFTRAMDMIVDKTNLGFGPRSWRYAVTIENGHITNWFIEEGKEDDHEHDPYLYTNPEYILNCLRDGN